MAYAVIRVRGPVNVNRNIEYTMKLLNLTRVNHCIVIPEDPVVQGMLRKVKDYITWGEVDEDTLTQMIDARGRLQGDHNVSDDYLNQNSDFASIQAFAKGIVDGGTRYSELADVKPIFRLSPPRKGYEGIKRSFRAGGALGYRGEDINDLIKRML